MPNANEFFPSKYLKAADLKGREPVLVIREVSYEPVGQQKQMKMVVYFRGHEKGLVCNKTNCSRIIQIAGSAMTEEWVGVSIRLYSTEVEFQGQVMDGIRIRPPQPSRTNPLRPAPAQSTRAQDRLADMLPANDEPDPDRQPLDDDEPLPF